LVSAAGLRAPDNQRFIALNAALSGYVSS